MKYLKKKGFTTLLFSAILMVTITSCDLDDDNNVNPNNNEDPLYGFLAAVNDPDGRVNFLHTTTELGPDNSFDRETALELPGYSRFWAREQSKEFLIGQSEDMTITKWRINDDGEFEKGEIVSLQGEGVTWIGQRGAFVSDTEFYYIDNTQGQIIVINTEEMVIDRIIQLPPQLGEEYEGLYSVGLNGAYPVANGKLYITVTWSDYESITKDATGVAIVDLNSDQVTYAEDDRLAGGLLPVLTENGDLYISSGWITNYGQQLRKDGVKGGMLRIKAGETDFDPDFFIKFDKVGQDIVPSPVNNKAYIRVLDEGIMPWSGDKVAGDYFDNHWQVALIDLPTGDIEIVDEIPHLIWFGTMDMDGTKYIEQQVEIAGSDGDRVVQIKEASGNGKSFPSKIFECSSCAFIQEIARLR
ncbi:MAG: hypothetical protein WD431_00225 [Cyclobacteriaceae bacterium]